MKPFEPHEDDGNLHIVKGKTHACFDVGKGQSLDERGQNERTRAVLKAMGMEKYINGNTLVEEDGDEEGDDGYCSHCGRGGY